MKSRGQFQSSVLQGTGVLGRPWPVAGAHSREEGHHKQLQLPSGMPGIWPGQKQTFPDSDQEQGSELLAFRAPAPKIGLASLSPVPIGHLPPFESLGKWYLHQLQGEVWLGSAFHISSNQISKSASGMALTPRPFLCLVLSSEFITFHLDSYKRLTTIFLGSTHL